MANILRNYILWPILALLSTAVIYLVLVLSLYNFFIRFNNIEELLWNGFVKKSLVIINDNRSEKLQLAINNLPSSILSKENSDIKIIVTKNPEINAFSAPGKRVILTTGLLNQVKSEKALLFIIGHEISHLLRKDHLYELSRILVSNIYSVITLSDLFSESLNMIDNQKVKRSEFIADQYALKLIYQIYGNASDIENIFYILKYNKKMNYPQQHLLTHPDIQDRINRLHLLISQQQSNNRLRNEESF